MCSIHYVSKTEETIDKSLLVVSVKRNTTGATIEQKLTTLPENTSF